MYKNAVRVVEDAKLPEGLRWYQIQGHFVFPVFATGGSLCSSAVAYLIRRLPAEGTALGKHGLHTECGGEWAAIEFPPEVSLDVAIGRIQEAIAELERCKVAVGQ